MPSNLPKHDLDRLIETHLAYAHALAANILRTLPPQVEKNELEAAAELGLVEAAKAFEPERNLRFETFAYYRIRGAIYDFLRSLHWYNKKAAAADRFDAAANEYMRDYTASAPPDDARGKAFQELDQLTGSITSAFLLSIESLGPDSLTAGDKPVDQALIEKEDAGRLRQAIAALPEKNRKLIEAYYFRGLSLAETGKTLGLSESWASRLHARSLDLLRKLLADSKISPAPAITG